MDTIPGPVLIIGAGISGLSLAQGLRKKGIPFLIFERDPSAHSRPQGWSFTIHFSLQRLQELLPDEIRQRLHIAEVNTAVKPNQSTSTFLNLEDCSTKWRIQPMYGDRMPVNRGKLRDLLMEGLEPYILWGKDLRSFEMTRHGVRAHFDDDTSYEGELLIGADGANSQVRSLTYGPERSNPTALPAYFLGTHARATERQIKPLLELDPVLFQGCHPTNPIWMWFSIMERPESEESLPTERLWTVQICISWLSPNGPADIPKSDAERVRLMREKARDFHPRLRRIFYDILTPDHRPIINVPLGLWWLPADGITPNSHGRVTLVGDAAHTMPLCKMSIRANSFPVKTLTAPWTAERD